jgi:hypothetical protein
MASRQFVDHKVPGFREPGRLFDRLPVPVLQQVRQMAASPDGQSSGGPSTSL